MVMTFLNSLFQKKPVSPYDPLPTTSAQMPSILGPSILASSISTAFAYGINVNEECLAGRMYVAKPLKAAGGIINYSAFQAWNPVGSGKRVMFYTFNTWLEASGNVKGFLVNTKLNGGATPLTSISGPVNSGASAGILEFYTDAPTSVPATFAPIDVPISSTANPGANALFSNGFIVLEPGTGVTIYNTTVNKGINGILVYSETSIT